MAILDTLDVAIGLVFAFLVFSLLASSANEAVAALLDSRARLLSRAVDGLLASSTAPPQGSTAAKPGVEGHGAAFFEHPLVRAISQESRVWTGKPSYLPAEVALAAFLDAGRKARLEVYDTAQSIRNGIDTLPVDSPIRAVLEDAWTRAKGDAKEFGERFDKWFSTFGERMSGVYRQRTQMMLMVISLAVAGSLNVDTFSIVKQLYRDKDVRQAMVEAAKKEIDRGAPEQVAPAAAALKTARDELDERLKELQAAIRERDGIKSASPASPSSEKVAVDDGSAASKKDTKVTGKSVEADARVAAAEKSAEAARKNLQSINERATRIADDRFKEIQQSNLAIGWAGVRIPVGRDEFLLFVLEKVFGILLTAFAMTLGAPFWFDLLKRLFEVRSVGKSLLDSGARREKTAAPPKDRSNP